VVLDWRAGERDAIGRVERTDRLRLLAVGILHVLRFVEDDAAPGDRAQHVDIAQRHAVAREHERDTRPRSEQSAATHSLAAVMDDNREVGRESGDLALPVADHGGRTHEEDGRGGTLLPVARDERKGRDALAKPHVVGETRAKAKA